MQFAAMHTLLHRTKPVRNSLFARPICPSELEDLLVPKCIVTAPAFFLARHAVTESRRAGDPALEYSFGVFAGKPPL